MKNNQSKASTNNIYTLDGRVPLLKAFNAVQLLVLGITVFNIVKKLI
jgi:hypothetical protein